MLRAWTTTKGLGSCGHSLAVGASSVALRLGDGVAHLAGLHTCGLVWVCPVCSPKIRQRRADESDSALRVAVELGRGVMFLSLTCRHTAGDRLLDVRQRQERAWARLRRSKPWRRLVRDHGLGYIQQREVTHGENGWHPHRHLALILDAPMTDEDTEATRAALWAAWEVALGAEGLTAVEAWGLDLRAADEAGLGAYMLKVRGVDLDLAMELHRGDLKEGRAGHRTPEQILGDALDSGEVRDRDLWREYERATAGWRMTTWSTGLREQLRQEPEQTDEELAALGVEGETLATLSPTVWRSIRAASHGGADLLRAAEAGTWVAYLLDLVGSRGWDRGGG